ncbi:MAG: [FeFe] hydrogenase H-cluster maturation GTPase HydF [Acutalibacteraceae bacterium]|nr:[FeFe] hydrogenase H-cluster maturation GTPase HydF [Acutalibacteraceae bacterium]
MSLANTPSGNRLHIGIFGKRNSGKSSLLNAITGQEIALVSDVKGTTTDPVSKAMEIHPIGPCLLIDTAGFDDSGDLGSMRIEKTKAVLDKTDIAVLVFTDMQMEPEAQWIAMLRQRNIPILAVVNQIDRIEQVQEIKRQIEQRFSLSPLLVSAKEKTGVSQIKNEILRLLPPDFEAQSLTGSLVQPEDVVLLVMPQDNQAPKGRLILPQVQTIRDLLDQHCIVMCVSLEQLSTALKSLVKPPKLIITDSQVFAQVYPLKPEGTLLTSFSILLAAYKGDLSVFIKGANALDTLNDNSHVLIAEACTHAPLQEDIGRAKIPNMLRKKYGEQLRITVVSGSQFPNDLSEYQLIIHCGACMFNRKHVLTRVEQAEQQGVPITNYGVVLAKLTGILDQISI